MSGGEQQMLALVRAYITQPSYVLLDEVSMGLAPIVVDAIFEFLRNLAERQDRIFEVTNKIAKGDNQ